ncbi:MAG: hypothetical protein MJA29_05865 [Candidatus Omnitrophica bacterium]|nr:hypothetical protein [Candidatus Omnitrophota bacterium]
MKISKKSSSVYARDTTLNAPRALIYEVNQQGVPPYNNTNYLNERIIRH